MMSSSAAPASALWKPTTVVNLRDTSDYDVYIGRPGKGLSGYFGNPLKLGVLCPECGLFHARGGTIACFERWFLRRLSADAIYRDCVLSLQGKRLGCFCKPKACHGDVIARWVNAQTEPKGS